MLGTSLMRYYQLERRALLGLVAACEPAPRGPRLESIPADHDTGTREDATGAGVRSAAGAGPRGRAGVGIGACQLPANQPASHRRSRQGSSGAPRRRPRRPSVRALRAVQQLRTAEAASRLPTAAAVVEHGEAVSDGPKGSSQK